MEFKKLLYLKCYFRVCFIIITNLYCIPTYLLWMWFFLLPFRILNFPTYWYVEGIMYRWLLTVVASWSWGAGYQIVELGDDINSCVKDRCLFLVNHQSTADVPLLMQAFSGKSVLQSVMWIMDRMFRYTNFGAVSVTHGDYFITQGKNTRDHQMKKLRDHLLNIFIGRNRRWIILFPEGGFLSKRKETSLKYALKNNFPILEHVTLPRVGAMDVILDTLRPEKIKEALENEEATLLTGTEEERMPLKWVIDVTMAYPEPQNPLDLVCICAASRPPCITYMYYRRYAVEDVPCHNIDSMRDWVFDRWAEKDELLREYYSTRQFPISPKIQPINRRSRDNCRQNTGSSKESTDTFEKSTDSLKKSTDTLKESPDTLKESPDILKSSTHTLTESPDILKLSTGTFNPNLDFSRQSKHNFEERKMSMQRNIESSKNAHVIHVPISNAWILFLHIFFISSTLFHMYVLHNMWNLIPGKC